MFYKYEYVRIRVSMTKMGRTVIFLVVFGFGSTDISVAVVFLFAVAMFCPMIEVHLGVISVRSVFTSVS